MASNNGRHKRKNLPPDYVGAISWALNRLQLELSPRLTYHNLQHTQDIVMPAVQVLAKQLKLAPDQEHLVTLAAAYHDIGFVEKYVDHESASIRIAVENLPRFGFDETRIAQVVGMIETTRLPQNPHNLLEEVIADADLDALGRVDFFQQNEALYQEVLGLGYHFSRLDWYQSQVEFISRHQYFTSAARLWRNEQKRCNLAKLKEKLLQIETIESQV